MQNEIKTEKTLLDEKGHLNEAGWARDLLLKYNKENIHAAIEDVKEWDYYYTGNDSYGLGLSMANLGKKRFLSVHFMDYENEKYYMNFSSYPISELESDQMPLNSLDNAAFDNKNVQCRYTRTKENHSIELKFENFRDGEDLEANLTLSIPKTDSMVIVVPFDEDPTLFYYNQKINCLKANGTVELGDKTYPFSPEDSFSVLDWGRGAWPPTSTWYWGSASGKVDGVDFGFNIGYGFGNTSAASENLLIYEGKAHKLEDIKFHIPESSYLEPWTFTSSDGRFEMDFTPIVDRHSNTPRGKYASNQHQVFGKFNGKAILDDGTVLKICDFMGFAEKIVNSYL
ncbi:DUF2804 domain-containing protein [Oceanobacillus longus]|uniref:DUF2804 domain-containing protein n=1 Tax=Oceanobacillus longus TaxID=930120 RepID=A0ABV8H335_9BACI